MEDFRPRLRRGVDGDGASVVRFCAFLEEACALANYINGGDGKMPANISKLLRPKPQPTLQNMRGSAARLADAPRDANGQKPRLQSTVEGK